MVDEPIAKANAKSPLATLPKKKTVPPSTTKANDAVPSLYDPKEWTIRNWKTLEACFVDVIEQMAKDDGVLVEDVVIEDLDSALVVAMFLDGEGIDAEAEGNWSEDALFLKVKALKLKRQSTHPRRAQTAAPARRPGAGTLSPPPTAATSPPAHVSSPAAEKAKAKKPAKPSGWYGLSSSDSEDDLPVPAPPSPAAPPAPSADEGLRLPALPLAPHPLVFVTTKPPIGDTKGKKRKAKSPPIDEDLKGKKRKTEAPPQDAARAKGPTPKVDLNVRHVRRLPPNPRAGTAPLISEAERQAIIDYLTAQVIPTNQLPNQAILYSRRAAEDKRKAPHDREADVDDEGEDPREKKRLRKAETGRDGVEAPWDVHGRRVHDPRRGRAEMSRVGGAVPGAVDGRRAKERDRHCAQTLQPSPRRPVPIVWKIGSALILTEGDILNSKYRVVALLGEGGQGKVFLCEVLAQPGLLMAIKTGCNTDLGLATEIRAMDRMRQMDPLQKTPLIQVQDSFEHQNHNFLVFRLMGPSAAVIRYEHGTRLSEDELRPAIWSILGCLEAAHAMGLIHGDIKPDNLVYGPGDYRVERYTDCFGQPRRTLVINTSRPKLFPIDWGLAAFGEHLNKGAPGTQGYHSPEQCYGAPADQSDYSYFTDMWALGVVVFELFTGCPFVRFDSNIFNPWEYLVAFEKLKGPMPIDMAKRIGCYRPDLFDPFTGHLVCPDGMPAKLALMKRYKPITTSMSNASPELQDMMDGLLELNPIKRLTAPMAKKHPFFSAHGYF